VVADQRTDLEFVSIPRLAQADAERFGDADAMVDGDRRWSFRSFAADALAATRAFIAAGIEPGDRVAIWAPNSAEWVLAALGVQGAGGAVVPINTRFKGAEAAHVLHTSGARMLITVDTFLGTDYPALLADQDLPQLERTVVLPASPRLNDMSPHVPQIVQTGGWGAFVGEGERVGEDEARARIDAVSAGDVADIIFTSGTTGRPKGVLVTHGQNLRCFGVYTDAIGLVAGDRSLIVNPFFHAFGYKAGWLSCLIRGATMVPVPVFDPDLVATRIEAERVTFLPGPPTLLQSILDFADKGTHDLTSLRLTVTGAAAIPVELIRRLRHKGLFDIVLTAYGLTECCGLVSVSQPDDAPEVIAEWSGRVIPDVELKAVDTDGNETKRGEQGELLVRGFNVTQGYIGDTAATEAAIDSHGWLHTGDIGVINDDGYVKITDRRKDMFIVGGFNAYPAEIENLMLAHPDISRVAVVGAPDPQMGEVGVAFVVAKEGESLAPDEVIAWARAHMANYKAPRRVELLDELPVNAAGKVDKVALRARVAG